MASTFHAYRFIILHNRVACSASIAARGAVKIRMPDASITGSLLSRKLHFKRNRVLGVRSQAADALPSTSLQIVWTGKSATDVVREFYAGVNRRDLDCVRDLIAEDCVYDDLIFPQPFVGKKDILEFFRNFTSGVSPDLQFVIDNISNDDSSAIGVTWHLEWRGKPFPFSKGCSFYRCELINGKRQIIYGRDSVEPAAKPGDVALVAINAVTSILERFPNLADRF